MLQYHILWKMFEIRHHYSQLIRSCAKVLLRIVMALFMVVIYHDYEKAKQVWLVGCININEKCRLS